MKTILPKTNTQDIQQAVPMPNNTYKMHIEAEHVEGVVSNDIEAVAQAVYKILQTERYDYIIYSNNYGVELNDMFGKPTYYAMPLIPDRIKEALIVDDRINDVDEFDVRESETEKGVVIADFTVHSIYGNLRLQKEVRIA